MNMAFPRTNPVPKLTTRGVVRSLSRIESRGSVKSRPLGKAGISFQSSISTQPLALQGGGLLLLKEAI